MSDTIVDLVQSMPVSGDPKEAWFVFHKTVAARLDEFRVVFSIIDEPTYALAKRIRSAVDGLAYAGFNDPRLTRFQDSAFACASRWFEALDAYNRSLDLKDGPAKTVARYLTWRKYFPQVDPRAAFVLAKRFGILRRTDPQHGPINLLLVGLRRKLRDNTAKQDSLGRWRAVFVRTYGRQCFPVLHKLPWEGEALERFASDIPLVDDSYHDVHFHDSKNGALASGFNKKTSMVVFSLLSSVPVQDLDAATVNAPVDQPVPRPVQQTDLFDNPLAAAA